MLFQIIWDVDPQIFQGIYLRWYGLMFALGYLAAYFLLTYILKREGADSGILDQISAFAIVWGVIGARLGHCLFYEPEIYLKNPVSILFVWKGGLASHGGIAGIILSFIYYSYRKKIDYVWVLSRAMIVGPLAGSFIRIGNLMNSEIYGFGTDLPWAFLFKQSQAVLSGQEMLIPRHPTQIYEAICYAITSLILFLYFYNHSKKGTLNNYRLIGIFLTGVFFSRFLIEMLKEDQVQFESQLYFNMGQLLSIPFILLGIFFLFYGKNKVFAPQLQKKGEPIQEED